MARSYAHIYLTIWNDPDFRTLTPDGQWLYFVMLTHPTITNCGVIEWRESRLVSMAAGMTPERLRVAAWELAQRRMIAVDVTTEEALVRSFVRHDGVLKSPNMTKAMVREHGAIASLRIMELVSREARRATEEEPDVKGSELAHPVTKQFMEPIGKGFEWVPDWFKNGSDSDTPQNGEGFRFGSPVPTPYPLPPKEKKCAPAADASDARPVKAVTYTDEFETFWKAWPNSKDKKTAAASFAKARKLASLETLMDAIPPLVRHYEAKEWDIPMAATWLNKERWNDVIDGPSTTPTQTDQPIRHPSLDVRLNQQRLRETQGAMNAGVIPHDQAQIDTLVKLITDAGGEAA